MNYYSIKDLETLSGIKAHTIRIWEKRYGLLCPDRSSTNIRSYSDGELKKLLNVSILVKHGYKISKVSAYDEATIREEILKLNGKLTESLSLIDQMIVSMVNFNAFRFEELLDKEIYKMGFEETIFNIIFPLLERVGVYWQIGTVFPAQEHFISNILRQRIIQESLKFDNSTSNQTILFFLKQNEFHEHSLLFYNYLALKAGYKTFYLGQDVPFEDIVRVTETQNIDSLFTAFINPIRIDEIEDYVEKISQLGIRKKLFVTGRQIMQLEPKLPRNIKVVSDVQTFNKYLTPVC